MLLNGKLIDCSHPLVMGIVNITPDSFYDGGKYLTGTSIEQRVTEIIEQGAAIIDVGAYSTRPGAAEVSQEEELQRLMLAMKVIRDVNPHIPVSIDTFRAGIVAKIVDAFGGVLVNDISAGELDGAMIDVVAANRLPYICMHMKGTPQTMQQHTGGYGDLITDVIDYFSFKIDRFRKAGIKDIVCDVGFGFSKTTPQNFELLSKLEAFRILSVPLLVGISRKSMIWKTLNCTPQQALNGTTALNMVALQKGAKILRVHDVKEAVEVVRLFEQL